MKRLESRRERRFSLLPSTVADLFAGAVIISALLFGLADTVYLATSYLPAIIKNTLNRRDYLSPDDEQLLEADKRRTLYVVRRNDDLLDNGYYGNSGR